MQRGEVKNPVMILVLTMVTCGIYGIIWLLGVVSDVNGGLGEERFNVGKEILLSIVTCGAWGIWFQWRLCEAVVEVSNKWGVKPQFDAPILFIIGMAGLGPFFVQQTLNAAWEQGNPGGQASV